MNPDRKIKELQKKVDSYESGSMKSLFNVTSENKKKFKIALRRYDGRFSSTSEFVKFCIKQQTKMSFKEFCEMGE
jgi:hypothetical protein